MLRSMYSGISGMRVNQTKLDVTGNNIANVGTTAFKGSRVRFQDMLSQSMAEAVGPGRNQGGTNPRQVGLGVQLAGIDTVMSQGMMQPTGRNLDVGLDGEGYFIVGRGPAPENNAAGVKVEANTHTMNGGNGMQVSFTRDGAFTLDHAGNLLTSDGYRVLGYAVGLKDGTGEDSINYAANGLCNFVDVDSEVGIKAKDTLVPLRIPEAVFVKASELPSTDNTKMNYIGNVPITDVSLKDEFPKIEITTDSGKFKGSQDVKVELKYEKVGTDTKWFIYINGKNTKVATDDSTGITADNIAAKLSGKSSPDPLYKQYKDDYEKILGGSTVKVAAPNNKLFPTGISDQDKARYSWSYTLTSEGDKKVTSFSFEKDGVIKAILDDGKVTALGQIGMATFRNTSGLKKLGKNMFQNTANSGEPNIRSGIGGDKNIDNSDSYGDMLQGMLEMSNVDLAEQFTDMIVASRAFQASGKMITTGDEILQDIINLKR